MIARLMFGLMLSLSSSGGQADELRPAYLDMREMTANVFAVVWKTWAPAMGGLPIGVRLPTSCRNVVEPVRGVETGASFERWTTQCPGGLKGREIAIDGLSATPTEVLAHMTYADGSTQVVRLTPDAASFVVSGAQTRLDIARTYFVLGVAHILAGLDHLLFVLTLVLLIKQRWALLKTVTAFTLAHSVTLAGASLGYMSLPQKPMEAAIALSIAFTARELAVEGRGSDSLARRSPWIVAFAFGLLHGFGFAGALKEIGLPPKETPLALLTFNVGVEAGQLIFVVAILLFLRAASALFDAPRILALRSAAYVIGVASMTWFVFRVSFF